MGDESHDGLVDWLRGAESPTEPREAFDRQLRTELFGEQLVSEAAPSSVLEADRDVQLPNEPSPLVAPSRRRSRTPLLTAAAAAVVVVVGGLLWWSTVGDNSTEVVTDLVPTSTTIEVTTTIPDADAIDVEVARQACVEFAAASFGGRDRLQVVGPNNGAHLTTSDEVIEAAEMLGDAVARLRADLDSAGVGGDDFERDAARLDVLITRASSIAESGRWTGAIEQLNAAEELLIAIDATLTSQGVPQCF